jgi:hypothetical protein
MKRALPAAPVEPTSEPLVKRTCSDDTTSSSPMKLLQFIVASALRYPLCDFDCGMPGMCRPMSLKRVLDAMQIPARGRFLDLGAGQGIPCMAAALLCGATAMGIEHGPNAYQWSVNALSRFAPRNAALYDVTPLHRDIFELKDLLGAEYIYSFDAAFPPELREYIADLLSNDPFWKVFASSTKPAFWEDRLPQGMIKLVAKVPVQMTVSGERHTFYVFQRVQPQE